jgi:hypothetical protein
MNSKLAKTIQYIVVFLCPLTAFSQDGWRDSCLQGTGNACFKHGTILFLTGSAMRASTEAHRVDPQKLIDSGSCFKAISASWAEYHTCLKAGNGGCTPVSDPQSKISACEAMADPATINAAFPPKSPVPSSVAGVGPYSGPLGFDRGMQSTMHCGNNPESWVRGSVTLDTNTGRANIQVQLETDSVAAGPKGQLHIVFEQSTGINPADNKPILKPVYTVDTDELGIGGKRSGQASIVTRSASADVPLDVAKLVSHVSIDAECTGQSNAWFGFITDQDIQNAFKTAGEAAAASQ